MEIAVTNEAAERLVEISKEQEKPIRINGELVGGCGMTVEYALWWDERGTSDLEVATDRIVFLVDQETVEYIGAEKLTVDYRPQQGFRLVTSQQILAYGLQVKERWS